MENKIEGILYELVILVERKKERIKLILDLTRNQSNLFSPRSIDKLNDNLKAKQSCIDDVNVIDNNFEENYAVFKQLSEKKNSEKSKKLFNRLKDGISSIQQMVLQIELMEKENAKKALGLVDSIKSNIHGVDRERKAFSSYSMKKSVVKNYSVDYKK